MPIRIIVYKSYCLIHLSKNNNKIDHITLTFDPTPFTSIKKVSWPYIDEIVSYLTLQ